MKTSTIIGVLVLWIIRKDSTIDAQTTREYKASFRNLGAAATGSSVSHLQVPLAVPDILRTFSRTYIALAFVTNLAKEHEAEKSTIRELDNAKGNLRALLSEFVTAIKTFVPTFHLPSGDIIKNLTETVTPIEHHRLLKDISNHKAYDRELSPAEEWEHHLPILRKKYAEDGSYDHNAQVEETNRQKRQLGIAFLSILNLGVAAYTSSQLYKIHHGLDTLEKTTHLLGAQLDLQAHKLNLLIHDTKVLEGNVKVLINETTVMRQQIILESFIRDILHTTDRVLNEVANFNTGLSFLSVGRLHPSLLNTTAIAGAFEDITRQALAANFRPIRNDPMVVFESPVSVYADKNHVLDTIQILIHIPLLQGAASTIYQFLSNPLLVDDPSGNLALVNFRPSKTYLLLDEQQELATELSESEFRRCRPYPMVHHCPEITFLNKDPSSLCLFALFSNKEPQQICPMSFSKTQEIINVISPGSFFLSTAEDIQISRSYFSQKGEAPKPTTFENLSKGTHFIEMDEKTKLIATPHHVIKNHFSMTAVEKVLQKNFTLSVSSLFQPLEAPHLVTNWTEQLDFSNIKEIDMEDFRNKLRTLENEYKLSQQTSWFHILWVSLVALFGFLGCFYIVTKCRSYFATKSHHKRYRQARQREYESELEGIRRELRGTLPAREETIPLDRIIKEPDFSGGTLSGLPSPPLSLASSRPQSGPSSFQQGNKTINLNTIPRGQVQQPDQEQVQPQAYHQQQVQAQIHHQEQSQIHKRPVKPKKSINPFNF